MYKTICIVLMGLLLISLNALAQDDVSIDSDGNVSTGVSNTNGNLEVTGASGEDAIVGSASGTGAAGMYGVRTDNSNYGILGYDNYGVYGNSASGYAGYFQGDARVTGDLTVDGALNATLNETDPEVGTLVNGNWCISDGSVVNCDQSAPVTSEIDPVFISSPASGITAGLITNWNTAYGWGDHASAGYDTTDDSWTGTGDVYTTSGNVGIGTSSPGYKLEVTGSSMGSYIGYFVNDNNSSGNAYGLYAKGDAYGTGSDDGYGATFAAYGGSTGGQAYGTLNYAYAYGSSNAYGVYSYATGGSTTGTEYAFYGLGEGYFSGDVRMSSDAIISGDVGIGTTSPTHKLEVRGGTTTYLGYFYNDNNTSGSPTGIYARGDAYDTGNGYGHGGYFVGVGGSTSGQAYGIQNYAYAYGSSDAFAVYSVAGGSTTGRKYAFFGDGDGYFSGAVGIGAVTPAYKLQPKLTILSLR